jgi:hypothetical protein
MMCSEIDGYRSGLFGEETASACCPLGLYQVPTAVVLVA